MSLDNMDDIKEKKIDILKGKIQHINEIESQEQEKISTRKSKKAHAGYQPTPEQIALRRQKGMLVQLMYYINKRDFRLNNTK